MKQTVREIRPLILALLVIGGFFLFSAHKPMANSTQALTTPVESKPVALPLANVAQSLVADQKPVTRTGIYVPIMTYHHVGILENNPNKKPDPLIADLTVSPEDFEAQVQYFQDLGYNSVSLSEVYSAAESGGLLPSHPIVFTFDDGYKDVFTYAVPILQKHGFVGTFAIATELLGRPSYAAWDDVIAAQKSGMEIVSHSENHLDLINPIYSDADLHREIFESKTVLEQKLGGPVDFFVYPYGHYNQKVLGLVKSAGYKLALTTAFGMYVNQGSLLETPRVRVHGQDGLDKLKKIFSPAPRILSVPPNL